MHKFSAVTKAYSSHKNKGMKVKSWRPAEGVIHWLCILIACYSRVNTSGVGSLGISIILKQASIVKSKLKQFQIVRFQTNEMNFIEAYLNDSIIKNQDSICTLI